MRIAMWSGPRNLSTAMMRSWENRSDTEVLDEPLYAAYLAATGLDHPGAAEIIATGPVDPATAIAACVSAPMRRRSAIRNTWRITCCPRWTVAGSANHRGHVSGVDHRDFFAAWINDHDQEGDEGIDLQLAHAIVQLFDRRRQIGFNGETKSGFGR